MGRKIICDSCETAFREEYVRDAKVCPYCGASWDDEGDTEDIKQDELSFGEGIELGEYDSFDADKIDFWWYSIDAPEKLGGGSSGLTYATCTKCGTHTSFLYPIAKKDNFIMLDAREIDACQNCGNELNNHILAKRPVNWVDPRKKEMWTTENIPRCPICQSSQIHKISATNKIASAWAFGVLAAGHVSKTYKCDTCGSKF